MAGGEAVKRSDLPTRAISALAMIGVAGAALWAGGWAWTAFVTFIAAGVLWEWRALVAGAVASPRMRGLWNAAGIVYVLPAAAVLVILREQDPRLFGVIFPLAAVIGTDVGAYFTGRAFGGPKIAPRISPSKTWSGLVGGIVGASLALAAAIKLGDPKIPMGELLKLGAVFGGAAAIVAQSGDFFESWMKRRAGVKDSGRILPGHGGLFDRADGLIAVLFVIAIAMAGAMVPYASPILAR